MTEIEPENLGFGTIFQYPEPLSKSKFTDWLAEKGYNVHDTQTGALALGPEGIQVAQPHPDGIAEKDGVAILYNPSANLDGLADSSFITVKDTEGANFERVQSETREFWEAFDEEFDISEDIEFLELTIEGRIRVDKDANLSYLFKSLSKKHRQEKSFSTGFQVHMT